MNTQVDLTHHFLIAMPMLADPNFHQTLTYICEHSEMGCMGLVINRQVGLNLGEIFEQMNIQTSSRELRKNTVYYGGPVESERGFVLHEPVGNWNATLDTGHGIAVTTSRDILEAMAGGDGPEKALVTLGYAGWAAGQLEHELSQNAWLTCPAEPNIVFETQAKDKLSAAAAKLGVDLNLLASDAGHA
jgi:putative transcriptional regulator